MDTGSLLLILSLAILAGLLVAQPFYSDTNSRIEKDKLDDDAVQREMEYRHLLEAKDRVLSDLHELDADVALGIADSELSSKLRDEIESTIKRLSIRIDEFEELLPAGNRVIQPDKFQSPTSGTIPGEMIEDMIAARRRTRDEKSAGFCPHCGKVIKKSDLFCPACGSKVN